MKSFLRTWQLLVLFGLLLGTAATACTKKTEVPAPAADTTGNVNGTIAPAGSINQVMLTLPGASTGPVATPDAQGYFMFEKVEAGTYTVTFRENAGYIRPVYAPITLRAGATVSMGSIGVAQAGTPYATLRGTATWTRDNSNYTSTIIGGSVSLPNGMPGRLSLQATAPNGATTDAMVLSLPYVGATGLYRIESNPAAGSVTYLRSTSSPLALIGLFQTSGYPGLLGSVTITSVNPTARTLIGTFGFTAYDPKGSVAAGTDHIEVTNGAFNLSY